MENKNKQDQELFQRIDELLKDKRQVILYDTPETETMYTAKNYIKSKSMDENHVCRCTFHPEYGYEIILKNTGITKEDEEKRKSYAQYLATGE